MRRGNLDDLALFIRVARLGSFTRVAEEFETSISNVSHAIKRLEERLGYRLLKRTSRNVSVSEDGARLLENLEPAFASIEGALEVAGSDRGAITGTLRLTATREGYETIVQPALAAFVQAHPQATLEVLVEFGFRDIVADRFDAGIRLGEKVERDMIAVKLGPDARMAVVAAPSYLAQHERPKDPQALVRHRCINYRMNAANLLYAWEFEKDGQFLEVHVGGPLTFNEPQLMVDAAVRGLGVAYVSERQVEALISEGRLVRLLEPWTPPFPGFYLYHPASHRIRPILAAFIAKVREVAEQS